MMRPSSCHVHTTFCDGKASPEDMVQAAVGFDMASIGFSAHAGWPFASEWHLSAHRYDEYLAEIRRLKTAYAENITVLCGFEADWIPGVTAPDSAFYARFAPDFLIGSVHYVLPAKNRLARSGLWSVDAPAAEVSRGLAACFDGDGRRAVCAYYAAIRDMVASCDFDVVGHLDLPRKRNGELAFFDENSSWYRGELRAAVRTIAKSGKIVEMNTGAIARKAMDGIYPSDTLLSLLRKADIPITLNSDAHATTDLICAYDRALDAARRAGYREISRLSETGWKSESID